MHRGHTPSFVSTRWAGSKRRLLPALERALGSLGGDTAVDVFSGSGAVSHLLKRLGKRVHANDALASCQQTALALVVNGRARLSDEAVEALFRRDPTRNYEEHVARTWPERFYLEHENRELDVVAQNLHALPEGPERALGWHALFQAGLKKRPYALFHRANLALRTREVSRSFGNKASWDAPLEHHFRDALAEAHAAIFDDARAHVATRLDALDCPLDAELVYLDPPYVRRDGRGFDYADGYHLLEALLDYPNLEARVDTRRRHRPYVRAEATTDFRRGDAATAALQRIVDRAPRDAVVALSYRSDGVPSPGELQAMLERSGRRVVVHELGSRSYALARSESRELLFVARPGR